MKVRVDSPYRVPTDGSFRVAHAPTAPPAEAPGGKACRKALDKSIARLSDLQTHLYAQDERSVLLIFQAMDAAGKDGTVRAVMSGVNPSGCQVFSFKQPSAEELDHDFLWRCVKRLPERGRIGIFNRSYYEEVLVVRVHPEYLANQRLPRDIPLDQLWTERFESIEHLERHLARNGTLVLKFWLNVSHEEQRQRFISRIDEPRKNWKFSASDVRERARWDDYMHAYEELLNRTSSDHAPWFAIPADDKAYMRMTVASIIVDALSALDLKMPALPPDERAELERYRELLTTGDA